MSKPSKPHVALLASPGIGHLIPIVELARRLVAQHRFTVTVFAVARDDHEAEDELLRLASSSWTADVFNTLVLNVVDVALELEPNANVVAVILARIRATLPTLQSFILGMKVKPTAFIVDQFGIEAVKMVGKEFNLSKYVFIASNAWFLAYLVYLPYVRNEVNPNKPYCIPGCESISAGDWPRATIDSDNRANRYFVRIGLDVTTVDGILVNTWEELEPRTLRAFEDNESLKSIVKVPVYPIGPVIRKPDQVEKTELIEWLDAQPDKSVVYISFGSGGTISTQQTIELASGLELSKHRFIWVIRPPVENDRSASYFKSEHKSDESIYKFLPNGFLDRTRDLGKVIPRWAPQAEILKHRSVGGFASHCGWNSVMEGIVNGLPIIAWPLYAEQNMNSTMLAEHLGIAIRPKVKPSKGLVTREEIVRMVKHAMGNEGFGPRRKVEDLKMSANQALNEGGSSYCALSKFAQDSLNYLLTMVKPSKPHVALLASPALGHLIPMVELANRLVAQHGFTVTVFAVARDANGAEHELLRSASLQWEGQGLFNTIVLPNVMDVSKLEPNADVITTLLARVRVTLPNLRSLIFNMKVKPTAFIVDQFGTEALNVVGDEFNMLKYVFVATSAWFLAYYAYLTCTRSKVNPNMPFHIPGCESILPGDFPVPTIDPNNRVNSSFVSIGRYSVTTTDGILVNTWDDLEPRTLRAFESNKSLKSIVKVPVYPIGPVFRRPDHQVEKTELIEFLDAQPDKSVVYISFGSGGTISTQQTIELACGLELSKHRFIWVIRPPVENESFASLFKSEHKSDEKLDESIYKCLPNGFLDRTRDLGKVIPRWAPQTEILQHRSVGGFVSHCGWNSVMESIVNGLPIIAWPLYAEQDMNSTMLAEDLGIAIRPKVKPSKGIVTREEISNMVKYVMGSEGIGLRRTVEDLKMSANQALNEGGSSYCALSKVAKDCEKKFDLDYLRQI
ncbi:uncharacterized protein LOC141622179 [Silene latifolia]|uniref:uncharacterized protein LOC141622179 n=1 Tax=Silene latifolia TaxID=37657 RepID=UPI003D7830E3